MNRTFLIMPLIGLVIICLFFLIFILLEKNPNDPPSALLNKSLPNFSSINLYDTEEVLLSESLKGKYTLINFFASWCAPCRIENPDLVKLKNKYSSEDFEIVEFHWIGIKTHGQPQLLTIT